MYNIKNIWNNEAKYKKYLKTPFDPITLKY